MTAFSDETGRGAPMPTRESENKYLGGRTDAELEASFANMYYGWERGLNITQERFGNGETKFTETPMTDMELAARYVAAEIGLNIFEIANKAAFAPIIVYSQIQARIGPVFERLAALSASPVAQEPVGWEYEVAQSFSKEKGYHDWQRCLSPLKPDEFKHPYFRNLSPVYRASPPAPSAGVAADEIARACDDLRGIGHCGESTSDKIARQRRDAVIDEVRAAILALLSRAGDQKRPHEA